MTGTEYWRRIWLKPQLAAAGLVTLLLLLLPLWAVAQGYGVDSHVRARLLSSVESVAPGQPFELGILLSMDSGWHTYWESPSVGYPTSVEWELPSGFEAGPLRWPGPHKISDPSGLVDYGYSDEVLLITSLLPSSDLGEEEEVRIGASVSWLVCREICIPGDTTLTLSLPVSRQSPAAAHVTLFERYAATIPTPLQAGDAVSLQHRVRQTEAGIEVRLLLDGSGDLRIGAESPDFYPLEAESFAVTFGEPEGAETSALSDRAEAELILEIEPYGVDRPSVLKGVLAYELKADPAGTRHFRTVELALESGPFPGGLLAADFSAVLAEGGGETSLATYILFALLGGLLLNLMPCVLPVISLKVLGFVSQAGEERRRIRSLGLAFAAGIIATFIALALVVVLLQAGGEQIGWGFQFQSPGFVILLSGLVFVLGLALFGLLTIQLPGMSGIGGGGGRAAERESLTASFLNGVLATVLATPCTAPFLGSALGFAFTQSAGPVFVIFAATGLGMALPYAILAARPGWTRFLPKPGAWMERFKQLMGFLLMGTVLWLLWVLGKQLGMEAVIWTLAFLLCLSLSCWIIGQWLDLRSSRRRRLTAWIIAVAITAAGYNIFVHPLLASAENLAQLEPVAQADGERWQPFSVELVEELIASDHHVFVDFTAEWCWTCKVNELTVLAGDDVRERFAELDVQLIRADWTNRNAEIAQLLRAFGRSGVPLYVIFPSGRPDHPLVLPELITSGIVLGKLEEAVVLSRESTGVARSLELRQTAGAK